MRAGLIALVLAAALPAAAAPPKSKPPAPWPTGVYSSVWLSKVTGDLGGMEARFYEQGGRRMVEFVMCEGWCNTAYKVPLSRGGRGFTFSTPENMHFVAWPEGKDLRIAGWFGHEPFKDKPERLKRASKTWGISVANEKVR